MSLNVVFNSLQLSEIDIWYLDIGGKNDTRMKEGRDRERWRRVNDNKYFASYD